MADKNPLVSIVIPAYRAEQFIRDIHDSVVGQTYPDTEIFVIDDGSPDQTAEVARTYASEKLKVVVQPNSGACKARNRGMEMSQGAYIQFLDADDVLSRDKIEKQVAILEQNTGFLGVCPTVHFMNGEDYRTMKPREESFWIHDTDDPVDFLVRLYGGDGERWMVQTSAWLTPRSITEKIGPCMALKTNCMKVHQYIFALFP